MKKLLQYFDKALAIDPNYELAINNKHLATDAINKQNTTTATELLPNNKTAPSGEVVDDKQVNASISY